MLYRFFFVLLALLPCLALADIPSIVITPARMRTDVTRVANSTTVLDEKSFEQNGFVTLQDAAQSLPGSYLVRGGGPGSVSTLFTRGTESSHTLVLRDGVPVNDPSSTTSFFNFSDDFLGDVERIEAVRGPSSVLYGSSALGGVINLISKKPEAGKTTHRVNIATTTSGKVHADGLIGGQLGKVRYTAGVEGQHEQGEDIVPSRLAKNVGEKDSTDSYSLHGRLDYAVDKSTGFFARARWRDLGFSLDDDARDDPNYNGRNKNLFWQAGADHRWLKDRAEAKLSVSRDTGRRRYHNNPDAMSAGTVTELVRGTYDSERLYTDFQNSFSLPDFYTISDITLTGGTSYTYEYAGIRYISDGAYGPFDQTARAAQDNVGLFGEASARLFGRVDLNAGLRRDFPDGYTDHNTVRAGAVLQLPEIGGRIKSAYGTAYRTPGLYERYGVDSYGFVGSPGLAPEKSESWEAGVEKDVSAFGIENLLSAKATYFETTTRELIAFDFGPPVKYVNVGRAEIRGVESGLTLRPTAWLSSNVNWTWLDTLNDGSTTFASTPRGEQLLRRPHHVVTASLTANPTPEWDITPQLRWVGEQFDQTYSDAGAFVGRKLVGGYTLVDLATNYRLSEKTRLYGKINNLFDRQVETPNAFREPGFSILAGLTYHFDDEGQDL